MPKAHAPFRKRSLATVRKRVEPLVKQRRQQAPQQVAEVEAIYASAGVGLCVLDRDLRFVRINERLAEMNGRPVSDHIGRTVREVLPKLADFAEPLAKRLLETGEPILDLEFSGETPSQPGVERSWIEQWLPLRDAAGAIVGINIAVEEITARKRAEEALRDREQQLSFALEASLAIVFEWDVRRDRVRRIVSNDFALPPTGDRIGSFEDVVRAVHPDDRNGFRAAVEAALRSADGRYHSEHRFVAPGGAARWVAEFGAVEFDPDRMPLRLLGITHDISERKRAEAIIRKSEETERQRAAELQAIFDTAPIGLAIADPSGHRIRGNRANEELFGLAEGAELSKTAAQPAAYRVFRADRELPAAELPMQRAVRGETVSGEEMEVVCGDGRQITVLARAKPLLDPNGKPHGAVGAFLDITGRKKGEEALRAANNTFRHLVEHSPFGIYVVDSDFRLVQVSDGAQKVFENVRPLIGRDFGEVLRSIWPEPFASDAIAAFRHTLESGEPYHAPGTVERRADIDAKEAYDWRIERLILPDGRPGVVCHFYDLSERQRHEEHIKLLMREMNHRSKNMLALVQSIAVLTCSTSRDEFIQRFSERIQSLAAGHDLLVESRWKSVALRDLVNSQLSHFADLIGSRITAIGPALSLTPAAAQAFGMALHELATNAAKYGALSNETGRVAIAWSMSGGDPGQRRFTMSWIESGGPLVAKPQVLGFGSRVMVDMIEMSIEGQVTLDYEPNGIEWRVGCAAASAIESGAETDAGATKRASVDRRQQSGNRVLVVEDEPVIAAEIASALRQAGMEVIGPAGSVRQALALLEDGGCDAAVLDVNMRGETTEPVARRLRASKIRFATISGYNKDQLPPAFGPEPHLVKPLQSEFVVATVKRCLSGDRD